MYQQQLNKYKDHLVAKKAERSLLEKQLTSLEEQLLEYTQHYEDATTARSIIQHVAKNLQNELQFHISSLVTTAIQTVFEEEIEFYVEFVERRGKTECDFYFIKNNEKFKPITSSGGGLLDVASLALRMAFWNLNRTNHVFLLDEPCKFVSKDRMPLVVEMFKTLSEKLEIQLIIVSHISDFIEGADKEFRIENGRLM